MIEIDGRTFIESLNRLSSTWIKHNGDFETPTRITIEDSYIHLDTILPLVTCRVSIPVENKKEENWTAIVEGRILKSISTIQKDETFKLSNDTSSLIVRTSKNKSRIRKLSEEVLETRKIPEVKEELTPSVVVDAETLKQTTRFVSTIKEPLAGRDLERSILIESKDKMLNIASTDGPHLAVASINCDEPCDIDALLDAKLFEALVKVHTETTKLYDLGNAVTATSKNTVVKVPKLIGKFPPYKKILESNPCKTAMPVDRKELAKGLQILNATAGKECLLNIKATGEQIELTTVADTSGDVYPLQGNKGHHIVQSRQLPDKTTELTVKINDITNAVSTCKAEEVKLKFADSGLFVALEDQNGWLQVFTVSQQS